jgi:anaerobic selenocysteine-containing dehydrogenase
MGSRISRRRFLRMGVVGAASAALTGCKRIRPWVTLVPYVKPPEEQIAGVATWYASTCRQCPAGCGVIVRVMNGRALKLEGNPEHPLNQGKLCARGQAGLQVLYNPDRISGPVLQSERGSRKFKSIPWNEALNTLYERVQAAGSSVAVWCDSTTSGHLLDLFQRFTKAIGARAPIVFDLYTALNGYSALAAASQELFGTTALPAYRLRDADIVLSFGADFLGTWTSAVYYGREFGAFRGQPLGKRGYLVQLEPRMSITGAKADSWLPIRPGSEALVAQALVSLIADLDAGPAERVARARQLATSVDIGQVTDMSELSREQLVELARIFATADRPVAIPGAAPSVRDHPVDAVLAVQALNLIGGAGLQLSAAPPASALVEASYASPADALDLVQAMASGAVKLLLVHGANPVFALPPAFGFQEALKQVSTVVSFSPMVDETTAWADLIMPDHTYLEGWGYQVVAPNPAGPIVSSQQPVVTPVFDTRATADIVLTIARGLAASAAQLPWLDEVALLKEVITQLPPGAQDGAGPEVLWARFQQHGGWWPAVPTAASLPAASPALKSVGLAEFEGSEQSYPYYLHLYPSDFLSDGRGASQPWLQGSPDPMSTVAWQTWVELHPSTGAKLGITDGDVVRVTSLLGSLEVPAYLFPAVRPDTVSMPVGQGHSDYGRYASDRGSNPMLLVGAPSGSNASAASWQRVRVNIEATRTSVELALFENKIGVTEGFINEAFPGQ